MTRRLVLLTEGRLNPNDAKTAAGLLRYRPQDVCCVLDRTRAGEDLQALMGAGAGIPIVGSVEEALALQPTGLLIGIAISGGVLPEQWRTMIRSFLQRGLEVINGLHTLISADPELADVAAQNGATITDLRRPPTGLPISDARARQHQGFRVLTVGTDANLGKKTTALELTAAARSAGWDAQFIATGQTGIMIAGEGIAVDAVPADFVGGAVESMILANQQHELLFIEGQGAITHPGFSAVTCGVIHGAVPQALILCHDPVRRTMRGTSYPVMPPREALELHLSLARALGPCTAIGLSVITHALSDDEARAAVAELEEQMNLPATDVLRFGPDKLLKAVEHLKAQA